MGSVARAAVYVVSNAVVLGLLPVALAHGNDGPMNADMDMGAEEAVKPDADSYPPTYFNHPDHRGVLFAHIALMLVSWVFLLPLATMFSIARSRYTLPTQTVFLATNAFGLVFGVVYNAKTPDLYPNNAHHKLGWFVTWVLSAQVLVSLLGRITGTFKKSGSKAGVDPRAERQSFIPVSQAAMEEHHRDHTSRYSPARRLSNDSGQGTEPRTESLRGHSLSSTPDEIASPVREAHKEYLEDDEDEELDADLPALPRGGAARSLAMKISGLISSRTWSVLLFGYNFVDRTNLMLGWITLCTGVITYGRFFEGHGIFTGLAHWIKGGVFFWHGLFTLGRWSGSFGEVGWAWNVKPKPTHNKWRPSAEFVESALIFTYGITNIFLEHLGNSGNEWSAQDLEHVSITVLFIGGGLCGILVESMRIRDLLNITVTEAAHANPSDTHEEEPRSYAFSLNPFPALVILLLGFMMSSHTQSSMIASMVHKQWGNLLTGASVARGVTYMLIYLKPPTSILPSRPPTELLASFCLISGGLIFMASSGDTVDGMVHYNLDAMFVYTVTMGLVGLLMAWEIIVIAIKGWAVQKEGGRPLSSNNTYRMA